jgi:predicted alpha/beta-hydrolase family hydrolase
MACYLEFVVSSTGFTFDVDGRTGSGLFYGMGQPCARVVLGHGAGGRQSHPFMVGIACALARRKIHVFTFDFLYASAGRRAPDPTHVLETTWRAALAALRVRWSSPAVPLFIGGKSMGGRIATHVAADEDVGAQQLAGLVLLGYPLHPPGKPEQLRAAHLTRVRAPMLFVQGSGDRFGRPDELRPIVESLYPGSRLFVVEGADHSLALPKGRGRRPDEVIETVADEVARFVTG